MDTFQHDVRHGLRLLLKYPAFTGVALLTLAIGIGANVAIFSVVNAVLLKPLPYPEADQIVRVRERRPSMRGMPSQSVMTSDTLFGLTPALQSARVSLVQSLNEGSIRSSGGFRLLRGNRTRSVLAVTEIALALVLLVGAGLLIEASSPSSTSTPGMTRPTSSLRH